MRLYQIDISPNFESRWSLSIDSGLRTSGFCFLDKEEKKIECWHMKEDKRPIQGLGFPEQYSRMLEQTDYYFDQIPKHVVPEELELIIEHSMIGGEFSGSLNMLVCIFLARVEEKKAAGRITLIKPRTTQWFLKVKSASSGMITSFVKTHFPKEVHRKGRLASHSADALLMQSFVNYEYVMNHFGISLRVPKIDHILRKDNFNDERRLRDWINRPGRSGSGGEDLQAQVHECGTASEDHQTIST